MKNYYVLSNGRVRRDGNTITVETADGAKRPLPIEDVESLYVYGEVDLNTKLLNFLNQRRVPLHVFNYYGFYAGSYYPREYLHSGFLLVKQVEHYSASEKRLALAQEIVRGAAHSIGRNLSYYERRRGGEEPEAEPASAPSEELEEAIDAAQEAPSLSDEAPVWERNGPFPPVSSLTAVRATVEGLTESIIEADEVNVLRGIEGKMRERYYAAWRHILTGDWSFERRVRRPPDNEVNALISFGNGFLYSVCLSELYRTQLTPTISYLHEPGARRFSLALDLSEIFKPLLVDRAIFTLLNKGQLKESHFDRSLDGCFLNDAGKRLYLAALEERLGTTIQHRTLGRHVSYRHLIRLECYKLVRHLTGVENYHAFRSWW